MHIKPDAEVVTHIGHGKNIGNTMGAVPNLTRAARELAHLISIGPSSIALNVHVMIGLLHILEERVVEKTLTIEPVLRIILEAGR